MQQGGLTQVGDAEVVGEALLEQGAPHEGGVVDDLGPRVQLGTVEQVEHVSADDGGHGGVAAEHDGATDGFGLDADVVVEELHEVAALSSEGLDHRAREAARAAEVGLTHHLQGLAQATGDRGEAVLVGDEVGALVDEEDPVDDVESVGGVGEGGERLDAVVGLVVRGDADARLARADRFLLGGPLGAQEHGVGAVGGHVEPDPPAVAVLVETRSNEDSFVSPRTSRVSRRCFVPPPFER